MCATVLVDTHVAAFRSSAGTSIFLLFEKKNERNVYPQTPRWSCTSIGNLELTLKRVFSLASGCVTGDIQGRSGATIDPLWLIKKVLNQMAQPWLMPDQGIELHVGSFYKAPLQADNMPHLSKVCHEYGRSELVEKLNAGERIQMSLYDDAELLCSMFDWKHVGPWRILPGEHLPATVRADANLRYQPEPATAGHEWAPPAAFKIGRFGVVFEQADGQFAGKEVDPIAAMWEHEIAHPGCWASRIEAYLRSRRQIADIPKGAVASVDRKKIWAGYEDSDWAKTIDRLATRFPTADGVTTITLSDNPADVDLEDTLGFLPQDFITWSIPASNKPSLQMAMF